MDGGQSKWIDRYISHTDRLDWLKDEGKVDIYLLPKMPRDSGKDFNNLSCDSSNIIAFPTKSTLNTHILGCFNDFTCYFHSAALPLQLLHF